MKNQKPVFDGADMMDYLTLHASDANGKELYEKDSDASIFNIPAVYLSSILYVSGYMTQQEYYAITIMPCFKGEPVFRAPKVEKFSAGPHFRLAPGLQVEINLADYQAGEPVKFFKFILITQGSLALYWDVAPEEMGFLNRMVGDALVRGGYLKAGEPVRIKFTAVSQGKPRPGEKIYVKSALDEGFEVIDDEQGELPERDLEGYTNRKQFGDVGDEDPLILIQKDVLDKINQLVKEGMKKSKEVAGILLGQPYRLANSSRLLIEISAIVEAKKAPSTLTSVQFTVEVQDELDRVKSQQYPDTRKIGWYHSHPTPPVKTVEGEARSGVFFSQMDMRVHRQFREFWQVAMVVDGGGRDAAFYRWKDDACEAITECDAYSSYSDYQSNAS